MKKIDNWENIEERKEFKNPTAGGYVCAVVKVEDVEDKEYLKIYYDIVEGEFKGYYTNLKNEGVFKDYPNFIASYKKTAESFFKGTITAFEKSNNGYKFNWDEKTLVKKKVGLVLFEEEYQKANGSIGTSLKVDKAHSIQAIKDGDFKVPEKKLLDQSKSSTSGSPFGASTQSVEELPP